MRKFLRWVFGIKEPKQLAPFPFTTDDEDELPFWREVHVWSADRNANRYAAKRMDDILARLIAVPRGEVETFYIIQGQLAELYKFFNLSEFTEEKLIEVQKKFEKSHKKENDTEPQSLVERFGE